jgi:low temperature requirement protein LtrA
MCLLLLGVGFKLIFKEEEYHDFSGWLVWPLFTALLIIDLIYMSHANYRCHVIWIISKIIVCMPIPCILLLNGHEYFQKDWVIILLIWCVVWTLVKLKADSKFINKLKLNMEQNGVAGVVDLSESESKDKWTEWRSSGFMGPKVELWPPSLLVDFWKRDHQRAFARVRKMIGNGNEVLHPNLHIRDEENTRDWLMEFADLIFVGVIYKFADQMKYTLNDDFQNDWVIIESTVFFFAFFSLWLELVSEFVRFQNMPGAADDFIRFLYLLGICLMAIQIRPDQYLMSQINGFMLSFLISLVAICLLHLSYIWKRCGGAIIYCKIRVMVYGLIILSTVISMCISTYLIQNNYWLPFGTLLMNVLFLLFYSLNSFRVTELKSKRPWSFSSEGKEAIKRSGNHEESIEDHFLERFGLLIMITAGETILALVLGSTKYDWESETFFLLGTAFLMVYVIKMQYFLYNVALEDGHALVNNGFPGSVAFCAIHIFLGLSMLWVGVGWKLLLYGYKSKNVTSRVKSCMLPATVAVTMCLIFCRFTHEKYVTHKLSFLRVIPIAAFILFALYIQNRLIFSTSIVVFLTIIYLLDVDFYNKGIEYQDPEEHDDSTISENSR